MNFREFYSSGTSLIVDLDRAGILSEEVQRLICNVVLNQYRAVVLATPEPMRQRRLCLIDELPVFNESCGPLLEKMATEIRKYQTSFVFLHQGGSRFPGRTDNEFLRTILDMCRVKVLFRHNVDAEYFGKLVALAAHGGPRIKHVQTAIQQLAVGQEIVELIDQGEGSSVSEEQTTAEGTSDSTGNSDTLNETLTQVVRNVDQQSRSKGHAQSSSRAHGVSKSTAQQQTSSRTTSTTRKQTLVPKIETHTVVSSLQFFSKEEIEWGAAALLKELDTGEAIVMVDGVGV
ncbi:MAG: type IV secretory system conjugative DNA transfer family protein [Planctomycetaceae bacterium]|nr:type IV secretory system conjugative DNA transfer family protein [Planctomycetaceae bacterium]